MAWWWPFGRKKRPLTELEAWNADYREWLESLKTVFAAFPDHTRFEGMQLDEKTASVLNEIASLYLADACEAVSAFELKAERLRRYIDQQKASGTLPPRA